ncbi:hypothetical protein [Gymnodinialimonas sp.]
MKVENSYGLAFVALTVGALLSAGYVFGAHFIPVLAFGTLVSLGLACGTIFIFQSVQKGSASFRGCVCIASVSLNVSVIWFTYFSILWGSDVAIEIFSSGPVEVFAEIRSISQQMSFTIFNDARNLVMDSGFSITGSYLLVAWGIEAFAFILASFLGFRHGARTQFIDSRATLNEYGGNLREGGLPFLGALLVGSLKGLAKVAIVLGVIYLASEVFGIL